MNKSIFQQMTIKELRAWIENSHRSNDYDSYFEAACLELNNRQNN